MAAMTKAWSTDRMSTQNAVLCSCYYNAVQYPTLTSLDCSPACLLHTRDVACKSVQTELELRVKISIRSLASVYVTMTYSCHAEVSEDTATFCAHDAAILDLCRAGVAVHLAELELRLRARALGQGGITDNVAKSLSDRFTQSVLDGFIHWRKEPRGAQDENGSVPLRLVLLEDLALGVVADVHDVDETAQIELLGSKLGHGCCVIGI